MCQKTVEVRRMQNHLAKHARAKAKLEKQAKKQAAKDAKKEAATEEYKKQKERITEAKQEAFEQKTLSLSKALWYICGQYDPANLFHVTYKDTFKTPEDKLYFLQHWEVVLNIQCQCRGKNVMKGKLHTHMLAAYNHSEAKTTFRKKLTGKMVGNHAAKFMPVQHKKLQNNLTPRIQTYIHLMDVILYIQTEKGIHRKFNHQFPETLKSEYQKNLFLYHSLKNWKWRQVNYMKYCEGKIEFLSSKLSWTENSIVRQGIQKRIATYEQRLNQLQKQWGSWECYTADELEMDLDEWLGYCKRINLNVSSEEEKPRQDSPKE